MLAQLGPALAAESGSPEAVGSALLDKYVAAVNAHDTSSFADIHAESYIQHSGRSPNGLAAQIENFRGIFSRMPDVQTQVEDRVIAGDKVVASHGLLSNAYPATARYCSIRTTLHLEDYRYLARRKREIC